jgi:hypothetical protein
MEKVSVLEKCTKLPAQTVAKKQKCLSSLMDSALSIVEIATQSTRLVPVLVEDGRHTLKLTN